MILIAALWSIQLKKKVVSDTIGNKRQLNVADTQLNNTQPHHYYTQSTSRCSRCHWRQWRHVSNRKLMARGSRQLIDARWRQRCVVAYDHSDLIGRIDKPTCTLYIRAKEAIFPYINLISVPLEHRFTVLLLLLWHRHYVMTVSKCASSNVRNVLTCMSKSKRSSNSVWSCVRDGHGLDSSIDWIGLGRFVGGIAWVGLDWVGWPVIASKVKFSETQS